MKKNDHKRTKLERETIIIFNDAEEEAWVSTTSPSIARKLTRRLGNGFEKWAGSWEWKIEKDWVKLPSKRRKRVLTEEAKTKLSENMKRIKNAP